MRDPGASPFVIHRGGCHCGRVRFKVDAPERLEALDCNCSICRMGGFLHLIVPAARFRLLAGEDALTEYTFHTGTAKHRFCRHCGIKSFYVPRSHPDGIDVNVRCLDAGTMRHWRWRRSTTPTVKPRPRRSRIFRVSEAATQPGRNQRRQCRQWTQLRRRINRPRAL